MIRRMTFVRRAPSLPPDEFAGRWRAQAREERESAPAPVWGRRGWRTAWCGRAGRPRRTMTSPSLGSTTPTRSPAATPGAHRSHQTGWTALVVDLLLDPPVESVPFELRHARTTSL
jgi:hypothetical protein